MSVPAWLGIGAQRSGTTWFTDLLLRHPQVALPLDGRKEAHFFDRFLASPWSDAEVERYRALFDPANAAGEFTPAYLRCLWVPALARRACPDEVVVIALLRDPVERFASAMRWYATRPEVPSSAERRHYLGWVRDKGNDALWGGMYATQLAAWAREFRHERMLVLQYERVRKDPQAAVDLAWTAMGLAPVALGDTREASWTASERSDAAEPWRDVPGLRETLVHAYAPQVDAVVGEWGIDRSLWPDFA